MKEKLVIQFDLSTPQDAYKYAGIKLFRCFTLHGHMINRYYNLKIIFPFDIGILSFDDIIVYLFLDQRSERIESVYPIFFKITMKLR